MVFRISRFTALVITLVIIFFAFWYFAAKLLTNSLPDKFNQFATDSVYSDVNLYRNNFGIPHIIAQTDNDMFFMLGFTEAQDRLWQIDYLRRKAKGETAEIFGESEIPYDKFIKSLELDNLAHRTWNSMSRESRSSLISFTNGINFYLSKYSKKLPFEFGYLEYSPKKWLPTDCIAIFKYFSLQMSVGFSRDLLMGKIACYSGFDNAQMLVPQYPRTAPYIFDSAPAVIAPKVIDSAAVKQQKNTPASQTASLTPFDIPDELLAVSRRITGGSASVGSNIWAVSKNDTLTGRRNIVLACDPHLHLDIPSIWYEAQLTSGRINLTGMLIAGTPFMLIGRNNNISWGIANAMADDFDYFYEKLDEKHHNYYYADSCAKPVKFKNKIDTIKVRNKPDYLYYQRSTGKSNVISDFHPENSTASKKSHYNKPINNPKAGEYLERCCLTYKWTGSVPTDFFAPLLNIYASNNFDAFSEALKGWHAPVLNFVYSDNGGNIAVRAAGDLPIRRSECNPNFPNPAWKASCGWEGFITSDKLKSIVNPPHGLVYAANNKWAYNSSEFVSNYWDAPYRATRLDTMLHNFVSYSSRDAQLMQNDLYSVQAQNIVNRLLPILLKRYSGMTLAEKRCYEKLKKWNFNISIGFKSSIVFNQLYLQLADEIFKIQYGNTSFQKIMQMPSLVSTDIDDVLENPESNLMIYNRNGVVHNQESLLFTAFRKAVTALTRRFGNDDVHNWKYGNLHFIELQHPFAKFSILKSTFSLAKTPIGGNSSTLNNAEYSLNEPFRVTTGASCRFITDMTERFVYISLPGGSCGQVYSQHYSNQFQIWVYGGYVRLVHSAKPSAEFEKAVTITPRNEQ